MHYNTCKYEIDNISNGGRVRIWMKNVEGGWGGGSGGGGKRYTQTLWENRVSRTFRKLKLNNFVNLGATDLIFVSFYSKLTELLLSNTTTLKIQ